MRLSENLVLPNQDVIGPSEKFEVHFDNPPGHSPARFVTPIFDRESFQAQLQKSLNGKAENINIGGVYSGAYTDESYAIIIFALGGIAGGILGAIGQDIWNSIKSTLANVLKRNNGKRNLVEIGLKLEEVDVILHFESRSASNLPDMLDEADSLLSELKTVFEQDNSIFKNAKTIELRKTEDNKDYTCKLYSYPRVSLIESELKKKKEEKETRTED